MVKITKVTEDGIDIEVGPPAKAKKLCLCGQIRIDFDAEQVSIEDLPKKYREYAELNHFDEGGGWVHVETGCETLTAKLFAPGHDARFKGLLQMAHRQGGDVVFIQDGLSVSQGPVEFANEWTPGLVSAITNPVTAPKPKGRAKAKPANRKVTAKVGKGTYEGEIQLVGTGPDATEQFLFTVASTGKTKAASKFTIIEESA